MAKVYFQSVPYDKNAVTIALEAGVDGIIAPMENVESVRGLARCEVWPAEEVLFIGLDSKQDEEKALQSIRSGQKTVLAKGWEIIPVENLLAQSDQVLAEAENVERAKLACGILERGVSGLVAPASAINEIREIVANCKISAGREKLTRAKVTRTLQVGLGHRVCLDTLTIMHRGQGMLIGNSSAFTFLVHAETERNEYVASRPFRVNAGGVHSYIRLPGDKTTYLEELKAGDELLVVDNNGDSFIAILGRVKIEVRPMLLVEAEAYDEEGKKHTGAVFLQNAETIRLTSPDANPLSVVRIKPGDEVLCRLDQAGRHFGMRVKEEIQEK